MAGVVIAISSDPGVNFSHFAVANDAAAPSLYDYSDSIVVAEAAELVSYYSYTGAATYHYRELGVMHSQTSDDD